MKAKSLFTSTGCLLTLFLLLQQPISCHAQEYCDQARSQLLIGGLYLTQAGARLTHDVICGRLNDSRSTTYSVTLRGGVTYSIMSACDEDCGDIDLFLYDNYGNEIDSDEQLDDFPVVSVTPRYTAVFTLKVEMYDCNINPCYFGIGVFAM